MNKQEFMEDIKQLLQAEISGAVQHLDKRIGELAEGLQQVNSEMVTKIDLQELRSTIDEQSNTVLDAIGERADAVEETQKDHERRIARLEHRPA